MQSYAISIRASLWAYFNLLYFTLLCFTLLYFALLCFASPYFTLLYFALLYFTLLYFASFCFALLCLTLLYFALLYCAFCWRNYLSNPTYICTLPGNQWPQASLPSPGTPPPPPPPALAPMYTRNNLRTQLQQFPIELCMASERIPDADYSYYEMWRREWYIYVPRVGYLLPPRPSQIPYRLYHFWWPWV